MARLSVDVQLEILILVEETPPGLVDDVMKHVGLLQEVRIVPAGARSLDLNDLASDLLPDGMGVAPATVTASLSKTRLQHPGCSLQIIMADLENN